VTAVLLLAAACVSTPAAAPGLVAIGEGLSGPSGLNAAAYAHGLPKVSALAVDPTGRLWVATADSSDKGNDALYVINGPGASPISVVTGLHTPLGLLWHKDGLYVSSTGRVDEFTGFDGSEFARRRAVLTLPAGVGESNGLVLGPDGRIQLGISAPCDHCVPSSPLSASIISFTPDGGDQRVDAGEIRAPISLAYYPQTSDLLVTMNQRDDLGAKTPGDWLAVVRRGESWGFPACYGQGGSGCAGVPQPIAVLDKHAAVSGLAVVTHELGARLGPSALVAEWATGKVQRVALRRTRGRYIGTVTPFLTGLKHPVSLELGIDSALFVGDWATGTVYRIAAR
jgi:glucose/arabinose dehydrogenase